MTVLFRLPNNQTAPNLTLTTTLTRRALSGVVPENAVGLAVSIDGDAFSQDTDRVLILGDSFVIPSPSFADGLPLRVGQNLIAVRAIYADGSVSPTSTAQLIRVTRQGSLTQAPSGLVVKREPGATLIEFVGVDDTNVVGYNLWCATEPGGGGIGYQRVNLQTIQNPLTTEDVVELQDLEVQASLATNPDGSLKADPTFLRIRIDQEDQNRNVVQSDANEVYEFDEQTDLYRATLQISRVTETNQFSFRHLRNGNTATDPPTIPLGSIAGLDARVPVYYVATTLYYDPDTAQEYESPYSVEVAGAPLPILPAVGVYPQVSRQQILADQIRQILRTDPDISVQAGSVVRDTYLDPFATEATRLRFLLDFYHRCQSVSTLLEIDDPLGSGTSVAVSQSSYKQALKEALFLQTDQETQDVIDNAFDALAARNGVVRDPGREARGYCTFFTRTRPSVSVRIPLGTIVIGAGQVFRTLSAALIDAEQVASLYDPQTGRYSVVVPIRADQPGSASNLTRGQITQISPPIAGLSVRNDQDLIPGSDQDTNAVLAQRIQRALVGTDNSTVQGIQNMVSSVPGVQSVEIVPQGSELMLRGTDAVDVWVTAQSLAEVSDTFALSYGTAQNVRFLPGDQTGLRWVAQSSLLTPQNPLLGILEGQSGQGLRNVSTGQSFDLTNLTIVDYRTIVLSDQVAQPTVGSTAVVLGDLWYQDSGAYEMRQQPVSEVLSVLDEEQTELSYRFVRSEDPMRTGLSTISTDRIVLDDTTLSYQTVSGEIHVVLGQNIEYLDRLGATAESIVIQNSDLSQTYKGPNQQNPDYRLISGDQTNPWGFQRTENSTILSGQELRVSYQHTPNLTVRYQTPSVLGEIQRVLSVGKDVGANIIVKAAPTLRVRVGATVLIQPTQSNLLSPAEIDQNIRQALSDLINGGVGGRTIRQSDVVSAILGTEGVESMVLPMSGLNLEDGGLILWEPLSWDLSSDAVVVSATDQQIIWLVRDQTLYRTEDGGGPVGSEGLVYRDTLALTTVRNLSEMIAPGFSLIIGNNGLSIPGYSDDQTLRTELGPTATLEEIQARRVELTQNRVLVSISPDEDPTEYDWHLNYQTYGDTGVKDIEVPVLCNVALGGVEILYEPA